jgi:uncharacterized membrane protein
VFELKDVARDADPDKLIAALREVGILLAEHLPATGDNPNELPDGPSIQLK